MSKYLEENSQLNKLVEKILMDDGEYVKSLNPDLEARRKKILKKFDEAVRNALKNVSQEEWETFQSDEDLDKLATYLVESILYREDMDKLYFEMGMRSLYLLCQDLACRQDDLSYIN